MTHKSCLMILNLPHRIGDLENGLYRTQQWVTLPHRIGDLEIERQHECRGNGLPHRIGDLEINAVPVF